MPILLHALVAAGYVAVAIAIWRTAVRAPHGAAAAVDSAPVLALPLRGAIVVVWVLHVVLLREAALIDDTWRFGFALALSATMWLAVALFWLESYVAPLLSVWLVLLPLAALCALLPLAFPGSVALGRLSGADGGGYSPWLPVHLAVALAAYGPPDDRRGARAVHGRARSLAAPNARQRMAGRRRRRSGRALQHRTHDARAVAAAADDGAHPVPADRRRLRAADADRAERRRLFRGVVRQADPLRPTRTIFTLIAWAVFAALLIGRATRGWRGRLALSWTLGGFAMLILAYVGSRFVLEVVLHRV